MFKLKKGSLQTIVYTENDKDSYIRAGWKLLEEPKVVVKDKPEIEEVKEEVPRKYSNKYSYKKYDK